MVENKPKLIYILGSSHSGSTILQYILAGRPEAVGLGEVRQMADGRGWREQDLDCSCGTKVESCPIWGKLQPQQDESNVAWYNRLALQVKHACPKASHWIDSSKALHTIKPWLELANKGVIEDVRVIYLVRDARAWAFSDHNTRLRKGKPWRPTLMSTFTWWRHQKKILKTLNNPDKGYKHLILSYESLVFQTDAQLTRINEFCGFDSNADTREILEKSIVHDVFGNRIKNDPKKRANLTYDDRWQQQTILKRKG